MVLSCKALKVSTSLSTDSLSATTTVCCNADILDNVIILLASSSDGYSNTVISLLSRKVLISWLTESISLSLSMTSIDFSLLVNIYWDKKCATEHSFTPDI